MLEELGFTTTAGILWNSLAYLAFIGIIRGVLKEKHRGALLTICPAILGVYAGVFLHNWLLTALQAVVTTSGILLWAGVKKRIATDVMIFVVFVVDPALIYFSDQLKTNWDWVGMFGLNWVALGMVNLPKRVGYVIMNVGAVLLVIYGYHARTWVWFLLNVFFFCANIRALNLMRRQSLKAVK